MKLTILIMLMMNICLNAQSQFIDNFSSAELKGRLAQRGDWKFENNIASCEADEELFKKYKNHGPILKWPGNYSAGTLEFEMKSNDASRVVFTFNGKGHIFRVCLSGNRQANKYIYTRAIAWAEQSSKTNKGDSFIPEGMPHLSTINNQWIKFKIDFKGDHCRLQIGDFSTELTHKALSRKKSVAMITFAHGSFAIKNFKFTSMN